MAKARLDFRGVLPPDKRWYVSGGEDLSRWPRQRLWALWRELVARVVCRVSNMAVDLAEVDARAVSRHQQREHWRPDTAA